MTVPVISDLPPAPTRSDGPADFTPKSDAMIGALQPMVEQINIAIAWISGQITEAQAKAQAAASSANAASQSASAAADSANAAALSANAATDNGAAQVALAAEQVELATEQAELATTNGQVQVQLAAQQAQLATTNGQAQVAAAEQVKQQTEDIRDQAQIIADAMQTAAGVPSYTNKKGWVYTVKEDGSGLEWRPRHRIGEVVQASGPLDNTFLPLTGGLYLQSAYTELFAQVGLLGAQAGDAWTLVTGGSNPGVRRTAIGKDNVMLAPPAGSGTSAIYRSTDEGKNWLAINLSAQIGATGGTITGVATDGKGVWTAVGYTTSSTFFALRSLDNGLTWAKVTTPTFIGSNFGVATDGKGVWLVFGGSSSASIIRSVDNGLNWSLVLDRQGGQYASAAAVDDIGNWVVSAGAVAYVSSDNGASFTPKPTSNTGASVSTSYDVTTDKKGLWLMSYYVGSGGQVGLIKSYDNGYTWQSVSILGAGGSARGAATDRNGNWYVGITAGRIAMSRDNTLTWSIIPAATTKLASDREVEAPLMIGVDVLANSYYNTTASRSYAATPYDSSTLFQLPSVTTFKGLNSYIKAKEAA